MADVLLRVNVWSENLNGKDHLQNRDRRNHRNIIVRNTQSVTLLRSSGPGLGPVVNFVNPVMNIKAPQNFRVFFLLLCKQEFLKNFGALYSYSAKYVVYYCIAGASVIAITEGSYWSFFSDPSFIHLCNTEGLLTLRAEYNSVFMTLHSKLSTTFPVSFCNFKVINCRFSTALIATSASINKRSSRL